MAQTKTTATPTKQAPAQTTQQKENRSAVTSKASQQQLATISEADQQALANMVVSDAGTGFEEATRESYATPFLVILQDLSPQCKPKMAGYIKGAEPGMLFNTATQKLYSSPPRVVPCHYSQAVIEWVPRLKGGGFVAAYSVAEGMKLMAESVREKSKQIRPNGNELHLTSQHYVLLLDPEDGPSGVLIAMKSTQLKYSRRWMTSMKAAPYIEVMGQMRPPAMFDYSYQLGSEEEANDDGSWWSWSITERQRVVADKGNFTTTEAIVYRAARDFRTAMAAGRAKVDWDSMSTVDNSSSRPDIPGDVVHENDIDA